MRFINCLTNPKLISFDARLKLVYLEYYKDYIKVNDEYYTFQRIHDFSCDQRNQCDYKSYSCSSLVLINFQRQTFSDQCFGFIRLIPIDSKTKLELLLTKDYFELCCVVDE